MSLSEHVVHLLNIEHHYGDVKAVNQISLDIPTGIIASLIGPDGVGKSTLLSLIAGARKIQKGQVEVLGGDLRRRRIRKEISPRIAYMPQGLGKNLYASLSVYENIDFFGRLFGLARQERQSRIHDLLKSTGLEAFKERPVGKLSGGMKQKLGLCCALIHSPDLLILDEPTTGIDPLSRRQFWELIERIRGSRKDMSVLVATSNMEEAERFDWLAAINEGRLLITGTPNDILLHTNADTLEEAFIHLLPEKRGSLSQSLVTQQEEEQKLTDVIAIEAENLTRRFGDFVAVDSVNFRIRQGEIYGFLGSNGCGKTTTMKVLTGLLPASEGSVRLFGKEVDAQDIATRNRVGYMSQSFSLYGELTISQNLLLHARLFHLPANSVKPRVNELISTFKLEPYRDERAIELPLGIKQRLSLAVAVVHKPEILILDEPTSGVDPVARNQFWDLLINLAQNQGVTIFISTHFMNEGERCNRISLMHAGQVLVSGTAQELQKKQQSQSLEEAAIAYLEVASFDETDSADEAGKLEKVVTQAVSSTEDGTAFSRKVFGFAWRESLELLRDPIRLVFALLGSVVLMFILGYGISMDVEDIRFAVLDYDNTPQSRDYIHSISGSRYFIEDPPLHNSEEMEQRIRNGEISLAIEIPPGFGMALKRGHQTEVGAWVDGTMPFRAETASGYITGMHYHYIQDHIRRTSTQPLPVQPASLETRFIYNQDYKSLYAMAPAVIPLLLIFIPAILTALSVVREKELGTITNFYVTPVTRLEFLLGKQLPYIVVSMVSFFGLSLLAIFVFEVPFKGSFFALTLGALLYVSASTALGLLMSAFTRTQIAAIAGTGIVTMLPAIQFSGMIDPVTSMEGIGALIGQYYPTTYFLIISRGTFTKALELSDLVPELITLALFAPVLIMLCMLLLKKQEK